eukprot:374036_1
MTSSSETDDAKNEVWYFMDGENQVGPVVVSKVPESAGTLVWMEKWDTWKNRSDCKELEGVAGVKAETSSQYYYQDTSGKRAGPVDKWTLVNLHESDQINGSTLIWAISMDGWKAISEVSEFKSLISSKESSSTKDSKSSEKSETGNKNEKLVWHYCDKARKQQGPVTEDALRDMFLKGDIDKESLVWKNGLGSWTALGGIAELKQVTAEAKKEVDSTKSDNSKPVDKPAETPKATWFYVDNYRKQQGPVTEARLREIFLNAEVQKVSLVWKDGLAKWTPLGEVEELKKVVAEKPKDGATAMDTSDDKSKASPKVGSSAVKIAGLTSAISKDEVTAYFKKCGDIATFAETGHLMVNLLKDGTGALTGEALLTFAKNESAAQAVSTLNDTEIRSGVKITVVEDSKSSRKRKRFGAAPKKSRKKWKDVKNQSSVYVTGLPKDATVEEVGEYFKKCGIIKRNPQTDEPRIKMYKEKNGDVKGDCTVHYLKEDSVALAVEMLDDSDFRPGVKVRVEKAHFEMKGEKFIAKEKPKQEGSAVKMATNRRLKKVKDQTRELSWDEEPDEAGGLRIVILKHMFAASEAQPNPRQFYDTLEKEVGLECQRVGGPIEKLTIFEGSPVGAIALKFKAASSAEKCISTMNGRFFGGQEVVCEYFDGTDYRVKETEEDQQKRMEDFGKWLETDNHEEKAAKSAEINGEKADVKMNTENGVKPEEKLDSKMEITNVWSEINGAAHTGESQPSGDLPTIMIKYMFTPEEAKENPRQFYDQLDREVGIECQRLCGPIDTLRILEGSPDGEILLKFKNAGSAEKCISIMTGRFFNERSLECDYIDESQLTESSSKSGEESTQDRSKSPVSDGEKSKKK